MVTNQVRYELPKGAEIYPEEKLKVLQEVLTEDEIKDFMRIRVQEIIRDRVKEAKEMVWGMCNEEGGKYFEPYQKADQLCQSIWDKAMGEATKKAGLIAKA